MSLNHNYLLYFNRDRLWDSLSGESLLVLRRAGTAYAWCYQPAGQMLAAGDEGGSVYRLEWIGGDAKSIIVTATNRAQELAVPCPACRQEHADSPQQFGDEFACPTPGCGLRIRLDPFTIQPPAKTMPC